MIAIEAAVSMASNIDNDFKGRVGDCGGDLASSGGGVYGGEDRDLVNDSDITEVLSRNTRSC